MKEMPGFIYRLAHALAQCDDVDESTIVRLACRLRYSPKAAGLLTAFAEIGYCDNETVLSECDRILGVTGER